MDVTLPFPTLNSKVHWFWTDGPIFVVKYFPNHTRVPHDCAWFSALVKMKNTNSSLRGRAVWTMLVSSKRMSENLIDDEPVRESLHLWPNLPKKEFRANAFSGVRDHHDISLSFFPISPEFSRVLTLYASSPLHHQLVPVIFWMVLLLQ